MLLLAALRCNDSSQGEMTDDARDKIHRVMPRRELKRSSARTRSVIIAVRLILAPSFLIADSTQQNGAREERALRFRHPFATILARGFEETFLSRSRAT